MLELSADLRLFDEPLHDLGAMRELSVEDLHRDVPAEVRVVPSQDHAHPTACDLIEQLIGRRSERLRTGRVGGRRAAARFAGADRRAPECRTKTGIECVVWTGLIRC